MIAFANCTYKVLRDTSWDLPQGFIAEQTRSGSRKVRAANTEEPDSFSVVLQFPTVSDYQIFKTWYEVTDRRGTLSFSFPDIDNNSGILKEYRFADGGAPQGNNVAGEIIKVSMKWEAV
jgi:hypothetical protein